MRGETEEILGRKIAEQQDAVSDTRSAKVLSRSFFPVLLLFSLLLSACPLYNPASFTPPESSAPKNVLIVAPQLTLAWDPPATGASSITSYVVSYRVHGTSAWTNLATVPARAQPSYTVLYSTVGHGNFDFGVTAVAGTGADSPMHTSLDATANPTTGWFITWGSE